MSRRAGRAAAGGCTGPASLTAPRPRRQSAVSRGARSRTAIAREADWYVNSMRLGAHDAGGLQIAVEPQQPRTGSPRRRLRRYAGRRAARRSRHPAPARAGRPPSLRPSTGCPRRPRNPPPSSVPCCSMRVTAAAAAGSSCRSGGSSEFSKYSATRWKAGRRAVHQLEQFGAGLLLGGVDVLVAIDDIQIDRQLVLVRRQRA